MNQQNRRRQVRGKLLPASLGTSLVTAISMLSSAAWVHHTAEKERLSAMEEQLGTHLASKADLIVEQHAQALAGPAADEARGRIQALIERTLERDRDLVYGLFLAQDETPWAYASSATRGATLDPQAVLQRWIEVPAPPEGWSSPRAARRRTAVLGAEVLEVSRPVLGGGQVLGTIRYGFSTEPVARALASARSESAATQQRLLTWLSISAVLGTLLGALLLARQVRRITDSLRRLTQALDESAQGKLGVRVPVSSPDELGALAEASHRLQSAHEEALERLRTPRHTGLEGPRLERSGEPGPTPAEPGWLPGQRGELPAPRIAPQTGPPPMPEIESTPPAILIVDDNEINRFAAAEQVEQAGYLAVTANDGAEAVEKVKALTFAAVLMDCQMPVMDGYAATSEIRRWEAGKSHVPIIALTAHGAPGERDNVLESGMDDYLSKPLRPYALERMLRRYVRGPSLSVPSIEAPAPVPAERPVRELDPNVRRSPKLVELFLAQMPGQLGALEEAIEACDFELIARRAHKMRGSCLALGAEAMAREAELTQREALKRDFAGARERGAALRRHFEAAGVLLERERAGSAPAPVRRASAAP